MRPASAKAPRPSTGTVYSCFADARVTTTVAEADFSAPVCSLLPKSLSVIFRVLFCAVSPALRSSSDRLPTDEGQPDFLRFDGVDFERHRFNDQRLEGALVGA
ncbi:MAG: hypothetical protein WDN48_18355 [Pseudolabrys sp.]